MKINKEYQVILDERKRKRDVEFSKLEQEIITFSDVWYYVNKIISLREKYLNEVDSISAERFLSYQGILEKYVSNLSYCNVCFIEERLSVECGMNIRVMLSDICFSFGNVKIKEIIDVQLLKEIEKLISSADLKTS